MRRPGRLQLWLLTALFAGPLTLAAWMYYSGSSLVPAARSNKGALLLPIVPLAEALPNAEIHKVAPDHWLLLYANVGVCGDRCRDALVRLRQSRLMLGKEMQRLQRVRLRDELAPDTVDMRQHQGLITVTDKALVALLDRKRPAGLSEGGFYLIDPLGNLVMYFPPELKPRDMVDDIHHLLKLSNIG